MQLFVRWGVAHVAAIALTCLAPLVLAWWARRGNAAWRTRAAGAGFAILLLGQMAVLLLWLNYETALRWYHLMPLHLCDLVVFVCGLACLTRWRFAFEVAYFWGLAGTIHGLLTPDLLDGFPSAEFLFFFLGHGGVIASVIFMLVGFRMRPSWRSALRAYLALVAYAAVAGAFNAIFGTNYGFLCAKPFEPSLLDHLGPWPWYIGSLALVGIGSFALLYLPWAIFDARRAARSN